MSRIVCHGIVGVPAEILAVADKVKFESYSFTKPIDFDIHSFTNLPGGFSVITDLSDLLDIDRSILDVVFFSCCKGAESHIDKLDPSKFLATTFVVPIILPPTGDNVLFTEEDNVNLELFKVYEFDHEQPHGLLLDDTESGCVVLMVGVLKQCIKPS